MRESSTALLWKTRGKNNSNFEWLPIQGSKTPLGSSIGRKKWTLHFCQRWYTPCKKLLKQEWQTDTRTSGHYRPKFAFNKQHNSYHTTGCHNQLVWFTFRRHTVGIPAADSLLWIIRVSPQSFYANIGILPQSWSETHLLDSSLTIHHILLHSKLHNLNTLIEPSNLTIFVSVHWMKIMYL
jgi:hypothetical protein